jgi:hypothetical protein
MTTMTINTASALEAAKYGVAAPAATVKGRSLFGRMMDAMIESRMRRAEIESRRVMAMLGQPKFNSTDYAMLPFQGE